MFANISIAEFDPEILLRQFIGPLTEGERQNRSSYRTYCI